MSSTILSPTLESILFEGISVSRHIIKKWSQLQKRKICNHFLCVLLGTCRYFLLAMTEAFEGTA